MVLSLLFYLWATTQNKTKDFIEELEESDKQLEERINKSIKCANKAIKISNHLIKRLERKRKP